MIDPEQHLWPAAARKHHKMPSSGVSRICSLLLIVVPRLIPACGVGPTKLVQHAGGSQHRAQAGDADQGALHRAR